MNMHAISFSWKINIELGIMYVRGKYDSNGLMVLAWVKVIEDLTYFHRDDLVDKLE